VTEDEYRQFKGSSVAAALERSAVVRRRIGLKERPSITVRTLRPMNVRAPREAVESYAEWKYTLNEAVADIKSEIREQHQITRAEIRVSRQDILDAVKSSPVESVRLVCEIGSLFLGFALTIRFLLGIEIVNTVFAVFMLFSFAVYWVMAWVKERARSVSDENRKV
jgi:hypothetical protein